jgi:hypothetical protein
LDPLGMLQTIFLAGLLSSVAITSPFTPVQSVTRPAVVR